MTLTQILDKKSFIDEKTSTTENEVICPYTFFGKKYKEENKYSTLPTCETLVDHERIRLF